MVIILLGSQGAGKGTQAALLSERLGIPHVATGDLFREAIKHQTELGRRVKGYLDRGELVPDEVTVAVMRERLSQPDCQKGVILDGFPRNIEQARALDQILAEQGRQVDRVLDIRVSQETILERLTGRRVCRQCGANYHIRFNPPREEGKCDLCGGELYQRSDDRPEPIKKRLELYLTETRPVVNYYQERGLLTAIDGEGDIESVQRDILAALGLEGS